MNLIPLEARAILLKLLPKKSRKIKLKTFYGKLLKILYININ